MASLSTGESASPSSSLERVGEVLPAIGHLVERRERSERRPVGAEVVDHRAVREDGLVDVAQLVGQRRRDAYEERAPSTPVVRHPLSRTEHVDELAPALRALVETVERRERLRVDGIVLEPRAPSLDRAARVVEHGLAQLAETPPQLAPRGRVVFELDLDAQDLGEASAVSAGVDALERTARRKRDGCVVRCELQDLAVDLLGAGDVVELVLVEASHVHQDLGARQRRPCGCRRRRQVPPPRDRWPRSAC